MKKGFALLICACVKALETEQFAYPDLDEPPKQQYKYEYHDPEAHKNQ